MLPLTGFAVGWALAGNADWLLASREEPQRNPAPENPPRPINPSIPDEDVTGSDIPGLSRYPGSVRIEYIRENQEDTIWTEVEYLTDADTSQVREFYRDVFRTEGWSVDDIGFAQNAWIFFVVKDEREVFLELKPRGDIVEVDIEHTEPKEETPEVNTSGGNGNNADDGSNQQQSQPSPEAAPAASAPAPVAPVYDDDYDDYGEYED